MNNIFSEQISPYLRNLMDKIKTEKGADSAEYKALYYQYVQTDNEMAQMRESNSKHYEAAMSTDSTGLRLVERLYKRQATIDLTTACSAHCRYCLRQNYEKIIITPEDENDIMDYLKRDLYLKELLITGGDPLLIPDVFIHFVQRILAEAPNIRIIRVGTRLPVQNPGKLSPKLLQFFKENEGKAFFEVALQVNHVVELQSETKECIKELQSCGVTVYAQNVLLRNVNDSMNSLIELYDELRYLHVEAHYLFHPVPISHTAQFRMPLKEFLDYARKLTASGEIPGRSKPMFSVMTDVGKCVLYQGTLQEKDENGFYDIKTAYSLDDRRCWHSNYQLPQSARIDTDGQIIVKYLDGSF